MREYLYLYGQAVAMVVTEAGTPSTLYYLHNDHLGTTRFIIDANQAVVWEGRYQPFGEIEVTTSLIEFPLRLPGQYEDGETGLYYNYYRDYDPSIGRYIQADPIGIDRNYNNPMIHSAIKEGVPIIFVDEKEVENLNHLYSYSAQNPLRYTDLLGLDVTETIANNAAGLPNWKPGQKENHDCQAVCNFKYQMICTGAAIGTGLLTTPAGGAMAGGGCMLVKFLVCKSHCDKECPVGG